MTTLIVYACPTGALAKQLEEYFEESRRLFGPNRAHHYPPHCTLTGFFHDEPTAIGFYTEALDAAIAHLLRERPNPPVVISRLRLDDGFHRLTLSSPWLLRVAAEFARRTRSHAPDGELRLKDDLHLSLAYYDPFRSFPGRMHDELAALARTKLDLRQKVAWEIRLYERRERVDWVIHGAWPLS